MSKKKQKKTVKQKLTVKQKNFADEYIRTGNATEAYKAAYSVKGMSPTSINSEASTTLRKPIVKAYISEQLEKIESHKVMNANEALQRITMIARGESVTKQWFTVGKELVLEDVPPTTGEILNASKEILKRYPTSELERAQIRQAQAAATESEVKAQLAKQQIRDHQTTDNIVIKALKDMPQEEIVRLARELGNRHAESSN